ncbi:MAG: hypothetical protein JXL80_04645, partial [Planctomycetes bacterium]|nr:hypothetical protein [Planctomycetota bacterium]
MRWSPTILGVICLALAVSQVVWADTAQYQVAASADDAYATSTWSGYNQTTMYFPYTTGDRRAFMRWALDIPAGATITAATVQVKSNGNAGDANASTIRLQLVDSDSCPSFTTNPFSYDVSTSYVDWELSGTWTSGQWYTSSDISSLVQAFIDRGGYSTGNYLGLRGINASGSWKQAYQYDNASTDAAILNVTYTTNAAPDADAGSDQEVTDSDDSGYETVTLDGSGSSDSDGSITSWVWSEGGSPIASGETASVSLAVGTHTITLTVTDDDSATDTDTVTVTVNEAPEEIEDEFQVAASADDCYTTSTWSAYNQTTLYWPYTTGDRRAFMRWSIDIPSGSTIVSAYLKVKSEGGAGDANASTVRLQLVDSDSCPSFTTNPHATSVSTSYVDWSVSGTWTQDTWYTSPDISDLVQEFIDRAGYSTGNYLGLRGIQQSGSWKRAYQYDNASADAPILEVTYTSGGSSNETPVADAGSDQNVTDTDDSGYETVTLDGSGSSDSDGSITSWVWSEGGSPIASGETASVSLAVGTHTITLTVTDDESATDDDTVTVTVNAYTNVPPVADAGSDQNVTDTDDSGYETVTLDGSASSDSDGTITSWVWSEGGSPIASGETASVSLAVGTHTITLTVTDDDSDTDTDTVTVTVNAPSSEKDLEFQVELTSDDAAATSSDAGATQTAMYWPYTSTDRRSFMRWASYIPPEATITAAYLKVRSNGEAGNSSPSVVRIQLVDSDDCPAFTTSANPFSYDVGEDYVDWTVSGTWMAGQWYTSPDISDLVQDYIDRPGYEFGNYIGLRAMFGGSGSWKRAYTWDYGDHTSGPKLEIHYTGGIVLVDLWMADPEVRVAQKVYCQLFNVDDDQTLRAKLDGSTIYTKAEDLEAEEVFVADYRNLEAGEHTLL